MSRTETARLAFDIPAASPAGPARVELELVAHDGALTALRLLTLTTGPTGAPHGLALPPAAAPVLALAACQLAEYFAGHRKSFDIPQAPAGTPFQRRVWNAVAQIPYGQTRSYWWVAVRMGDPRALRAVGAANGANPLPIIVPCHRVIRHDGTLGGYSAGLDWKRFLLALEGVEVLRLTAPVA